MSVFDKLIPFLQGKLNDSGSFILAGKERIPIRRDAFFGLSPESSKKVVFVDGGNAEFLSGPNVSLQFARFYAGFWENNVRVKRELQECVIASVMQKKDADVNFDVTVFSMDGEELRKYQFDVFDQRIAFGKRRAEPYAVGNLMRKKLEIEFAASFAKTLSKGDLLVRDGEIDTDIEETQLLIDSSKNCSLLCVSKTCRLCTDSGSSALFVLEKLAPKGCWLYFAGGSVAFARMHENGKHIFRFDVPNIESLNSLPCLLSNSKDPSFLGYPYGLIDADKFAQVTKEEISQIKLRFALKSKELFGSLERSLDAHDILNKF
jgi:hypothetical protein